MNVSVPQLLEMMVDLEDDSEWPLKDTIEDEEDDRSVCYHIHDIKNSDFYQI